MVVTHYKTYNKSEFNPNFGRMYDTVRLWIDYRDAGQTFADELFVNCTSPEKVTKEKAKSTQIYYKAHLLYPDHTKDGQGWDIWLFSSGIKIQGSPAKWYFSNNADTLTLAQARKAFETLAEALQLPFETLLMAKTQRLDFSSVMTMDYEPRGYFGNLDYLNQYRRTLDPSGNTLYFKQTEKWILFYDKTKDAKDKGMTLPDWAKGKNLMRYEVRYLNPRRTHLYRTKETYIGDASGNKELYLGDLLNEHIYLACIDAWLDYYESIYKSVLITDLMTTNETLTKPTKVINSILAPIAAEVGLDCLRTMLDARRIANPDFDSKSYNRAWSKLTDLVGSAENASYTAVLEELNSKVRSRAKLIRERINDE